MPPGTQQLPINADEFVRCVERYLAMAVDARQVETADSQTENRRSAVDGTVTRTTTAAALFTPSSALGVQLAPAQLIPGYDGSEEHFQRFRVMLHALMSGATLMQLLKKLLVVHDCSSLGPNPLHVFV